VTECRRQELDFVFPLFFFGTVGSESGDQISKFWPFPFPGCRAGGTWGAPRGIPKNTDPPPCLGPNERLPIAFEIFDSNT